MIWKAAKNSAAILLGDILGGLINLSIAVCLIRYFGGAGFGAYSFALSFIYQFMVIDDIWLKPILIREISRDNAESGKLIGNSIILKLLVSSAAMLLIYAIIRVMNCPKEVLTLTRFAIANIPLISILASFEAVFKAGLNMPYYIGISFLSKLFYMAAVFMLLSAKGNINQFMLALVISNMINIFFITRILNKFIRLDFRIDFSLWRKILNNSWPLFLSAIFISIYTRLDHILLFKLKGPEQLGLYSAAVKLAEYFHFIPLAAAASVFPLMSKYFYISQEIFKNIYTLTYKYLSIFIVPIAVTIFFFSRQIISLLYGFDFLPAEAALKILIFAEIFVFFGIINSRILIATGNQMLELVFTGASALVSISLSLILIPHYGFAGAALAGLFSRGIGPLMGFLFLSTAPYSKCMFNSAVKPLLASIVMVTILFLSMATVKIIVVFAPIVYILTLSLIRGINIKNGLGFLKSTVQKLKLKEV